MSGSAARGTSHPASDEDAGLGTLPGTGEEGQGGDGVLDQGVLTMSSPDQLDWAEDPHGRLLMGQFG